MAALICTLINIYMLVIFIRIIMSWIPPTPGTTYAQIHEGFVRVTEPVLAPVRNALPPVNMGAARLDLSPIIVFLAGIIICRVIV